MDLTLLPETFAICRLASGEALPTWAAGSAGLLSITRTAEELSIVCEAAAAPEGITASRGWRCLRVAGPLDFALTGVLAALAAPLAEAGVSIFAVSTYDTDYLLVREAQLESALAALEQSGQSIAR